MYSLAVCRYYDNCFRGNSSDSMATIATLTSGLFSSVVNKVEPKNTQNTTTTVIIINIKYKNQKQQTMHQL